MTLPNGKLLLLGLAGIGWDALAARVADGRLPAIGALMGRGVAGRLRSPTPPSQLATWATIATGYAADRHGIVQAEEVWAGGTRPTGHASWRSDPIWLRLADAGVATAGIGWPATAPGASWPGAHVDPRFFVPSGHAFEDWLVPPGAAPESWADTLRDLRVHPDDMTGPMLRPFVPDMAAVDQDRDPRLIELALMIARLSSAHAAAMALIASARWDALLIHHDWLEKVADRFRGAGPPYDGVYDAAWTLIDQLIGALVQSLPDTTILIVSPGNPGEAGAIVAAGPGIARGALRGASTFDVAPTVLAHFGLADAQLPGRTLWPVATPLRAAAPLRQSEPPRPTDAADLARVAAFGHRPPQPPARWQSQRLAAEAELLLATDPAAAGARADAALALDPDNVPALGARAAAHVAAEESAPLPALARRIAAAAPGHVWAPLVQAGYHALRGEAAAAQPLLAQVERDGGPEDRLRAGAAWMMLDRRADAARLFERVLADQPDNVAALLGLAMARLARPLEAEPPLRRILELDPAHGPARDALITMLRTTGRAREADILRR
jgi:tetratricopeptide (TPR) repeat protein